MLYSQSKWVIFQHDGLTEQVKIAGMSFRFKLKAKRVGKIVSMASLKDKSKRSYEMVKAGKIADRLKKGIARVRVWLLPD